MSNFRIVVSSSSNRDLIAMFAASMERMKTHNKFNNPDVVTEG